MLRIITLATLTFSLVLLTPAPSRAAGTSAVSPVSLAELADRADLVVLAQVKDTDYLERRNIPVSGSAYLKVLLPYKTSGPLDILEVYEKGLHPNECYFPNPTVFEEGRRYLLFLRKDPEKESRFRGMPQGCALDVLVNDQNRYALRFPVDGIELSDPLESLAVKMNFSDGYAVVDDGELLAAERETLREAGHIAPHSPGQWIYTRGIPLHHVRELTALHQD